MSHVLLASLTMAGPAMDGASASKPAATVLAAPPGALPRQLVRYIAATSWKHQIPLMALTVGAFLLEVVPLELQRRIVNAAVKSRQFHAILVLCAIYAGAVVVQGALKLGVNVYRGWISERAKRDLRRRVSASPTATAELRQAELQGTAVSMIVAEVEPVGGFVGNSVSEPLQRIGVLATVLAYLIHVQTWMAAAALALYIPQLIFVPLMQGAMNRRTGLRVRTLRQIGSGIIARSKPRAPREQGGASRIDYVQQLSVGILEFKFTMNFLMNLCTHLQIIAVLLIGGWLVLNHRIEVGAVVAFISGVGRLTDPWGDLVNYFREASLTLVKYRLVANAVNASTAVPAAAAAMPPDLSSG